MGEVFGDLLPLAVTVAISPIPVIAVILMLLAPRAGSASAGFLAGWVAGILAASGLFVLLAGIAGFDSAGAGPSAPVSWVKLLLGLLLLALAVRQWRAPARAELPGWMRAIDQVTPGKAMGLGFLLSAVNPKNLMMCVAAGVAIGTGHLPGAQQVVLWLVFTVVAALSVAVPVLAYAVAADRVRGPLDLLKGWLQQHNAAVMTVLLLVIGMVLLGKGIGGLL